MYLWKMLHLIDFKTLLKCIHLDIYKTSTLFDSPFNYLSYNIKNFKIAVLYVKNKYKLLYYLLFIQQDKFKTI